MAMDLRRPGPGIVDLRIATPKFELLSYSRGTAASIGGIDSGLRTKGLYGL
jgi:hypothetical protein